jgi:hypothetical protein
VVDALEQLVDSLLYEGYALYPYTPGAAKNSTPTPFGIVYPPVYAATLTSTFDHLELRCVLEAPLDGVVSAEVRFLAADGERHKAQARQVTLAGAMVGALAVSPAQVEARVRDAGARPPLHVALSLGLEPLGDGAYEVVLRVENRTTVRSGLDRSGALARSLLSTIPIARVSGGRFVSALERPCASVNTFPVLATPADDTIVGAAIVLPDHPQIAPESRGGLFDSTEIEEALLLHVLALSDAEREQIEQQDPTVRAMIERAAAATPADIIALHGRVSLRDPDPDGDRDRESLTPPVPPPGLADPTRGEESADVDGVTFRRGGKVVIRPAADADLHARLLDGRTATIERIFIDYDGRAHLGVTVDGDPGQDLMRDTGRYLFFFAPEVEVVQP